MAKLKECFVDFFNSGFIFEANQYEIKYKIRFINSTIGFSGFVAFFIGLIRLYYESYVIGIADIIYSIIAFFILFNMRKAKSNIHLFSNITVSILFVFIFTIILFGKYPSSVSLLFLLIGAAFFLTGKQNAKKWTVVAALTLISSYFIFDVQMPYQSYEIILTSIYIIVFVLILNQYEALQNETKSKLEFMNENLEELVNKRTIQLQYAKEEIEQSNKEKSILIQELLSVGISLTSQSNYELLLEKIMLVCKKFSNADAGTLYLLSEDEKDLEFKVVHTDTLGIKMGGSGEELIWPPLSLYKEDNKPNDSMVAVKSVLEMKQFNFSDVYEVEEFNFEGTKIFDLSTGYRTKSMLVIPMKNRNNEVIGILQLLNKIDKDGEIVPFDKDDEVLISAMASLGAVSIHNHLLINNLENLLESFIKTIADTLEEKSLYTEHHALRVAALVDLISLKISEDETMFSDVSFSDDELKELNIAALLHDIGKIITPEAVMDKATRLETIFDRINSIAVKFEVLRRDCTIEYIQQKNMPNSNKEALEIKYNDTLVQIDEDEQFLIKCNTVGFISDEDIKRIKRIATKKIILNSKEVNFLCEDELKNITIRKGTLTNEERDIINNHVKVSYRMLKNLPFPKKYKNIPQIAGSHHKTVDGKGGYASEELIGKPLNFKEKILAICDVLEAITSPERPYKKPFTLSQSFNIIADMTKEGHLDKDIVKFIIDSKLYLEYANEYLDESQIDEVKIEL